MVLRCYAPECASLVCTTRRGQPVVALPMSPRRMHGAVARSRGIFVADRLGRPERDRAGVFAWGGAVGDSAPIPSQ